MCDILIVPNINFVNPEKYYKDKKLIEKYSKCRSLSGGYSFLFSRVWQMKK